MQRYSQLSGPGIYDETYLPSLIQIKSDKCEQEKEVLELSLERQRLDT